MSRIGAYDVATAKRVLNAANEFHALQQEQSRFGQQQGFFFITPAEGIKKNERAPCIELWFGQDDKLTFKPKRAGEKITRMVYNTFLSGDIGGNKRIIVLRMYGRLVAIAEDCG